MKPIIYILFTFYFFSNSLMSQSGCTDVPAINYNINALTNDGSCVYDIVAIDVSSSVNLSPTLNETSGLIEWNNFMYSHNDNTDKNIYKLDKLSGTIIQNLPLNTIQNIDWEEISQDENFIYIGDFGNNTNGNRANLKIYKIDKSTLETIPQIETINFTYSNQTIFTPQGANNTDFDCEAFVVTANEILLFTKQWVSKKTSIYSIPKTVGSHVANLITTINVDGLITGATLKEDSRLIALCGYNTSLQPFVYLIYDFYGLNFTNANKRKLDIKLPFHQIEGISTSNGLEYNLSNESFIQSPFINNPQKLHQLSLSSYLTNYFNFLSSKNFDKTNHKILLFPNPSNGEIQISDFQSANQAYQILDLNGKLMKSGNLNNSIINIQDLEKGIYLLKITNNQQVFKIIKK